MESPPAVRQHRAGEGTMEDGKAVVLDDTAHRLLSAWRLNYVQAFRYQAVERHLVPSKVAG